MAQVLDDTPYPLDQLIGRALNDAIAFRDRAGSLSYAELEHAVGGLAAALLAKGLARGDRVATWLNKSRVACLMPLAAARAGLIHVPINPLLKARQVAHILADSGARLMICGEQRRASLSLGDVPSACHLTDEDLFRPDGDVMPPSRADPAEIVAILYTSGSTGLPKGVVLSHANLWLGAISVAHYLRLQPSDRTLCLLPLSFDYGQNQLLSAWAAGACAVPFDYLVASDVVRAVEAFEISVLAGVPPLWTQLADVPWPPHTAERLRVIANSGGRLSVLLIRRLRALFPKADLHSMYGLTEAFRSTSLDPALVDEHPESIGTAIPFAEVKILRADETEAAPGEAGELVHAGPLVAQGYWRDPERTAQRFRPAPSCFEAGGIAVWSGDTVVRGEDGLLRFVGRADDMIKTAGNRVSPTEIEEVAIASGFAAEAVAWGTPDEALGQVIMLAVAGRPEDEDKLRNALRQELPNFMQPRAIFRYDALPRNPNGKFDRARLAAQHRS